MVAELVPRVQLTVFMLNKLRITSFQETVQFSLYTFDRIIYFLSLSRQSFSAAIFFTDEASAMQCLENCYGDRYTQSM
jgi:hypothetical protein